MWETTKLDYSYGKLEELYKSKNKLLKNGNHDTDFDSIIKNCKKLFSMKPNCKYDAQSKNQVFIQGGRKKSKRLIQKLNKKSLHIIRYIFFKKIEKKIFKVILLI